MVYQVDSPLYLRGVSISLIRLANLVLLQGALTRAELAEKIATDVRQVGHWFMDPSKEGYRKIGDRKAREIEAAFEKPPFWMDTPHHSVLENTFDVMPVAMRDALPTGKYLFPRLYENVIAGLGAGRFNDDFHIEVDGTIAVPAALITSRGWNIAQLAVVNTDGLSMFPTLNDGEPVVVNLADTKILSGKVYAIEDEDEGLRIKRLTKQRDGRILVRSDNPDKLNYPDDYITPSRTRVVGRVCYRSGEL